MIESFLTVVDNLLAVDPLELQESQQLFNTSARLIIEAEAYTTVFFIVVQRCTVLQRFVPACVQLLLKWTFSMQCCLCIFFSDAYFSSLHIQCIGCWKQYKQ